MGPDLREVDRTALGVHDERSARRGGTPQLLHTGEVAAEGLGGPQAKGEGGRPRDLTGIAVQRDAVNRQPADLAVREAGLGQASRMRAWRARTPFRRKARRRSSTLPLPSPGETSAKVPPRPTVTSIAEAAT